MSSSKSQSGDRRAPSCGSARCLFLVRVSLLTLFACGVGSAPGAAVDAEPAAGPAAGRNEAERAVAAARRMMTEVGFCALITVDAEGVPQARTMDPFPPEPDLTVWLGTRRGTRKLGQLAAEPRATLYYFDPQGPGYVTLIGRLTEVDDPAERERRFKPGWIEFYDDGHRGEDFVLLRFDAERLEIVSIPDELASAPKTWRPFVVELPLP